MLKRYRKAAALGLAGILVASVPIIAWAAGNWSTLPQGGATSFCASTSSGVVLPAGQGPYAVVPGSTQGTGQGICAQTVPAGPALTGNETVPADTNSGAQPYTITIPAAQLAGLTWNTPRNLLGNGALAITNTNGTATVTNAQTSAMTVAALSADRWGLDTNVASGAGRSAIVTSSPSPPTGFTNVMKVWRNSGSLGQPVCVLQEVPTPISKTLQGQIVTYSVYLDALAGLVADNGGTVNLVLIYGTGTDEGLSAGWTASPAITPAWTGIGTIVNQSVSISTTFTRYSVTASIPATATEVGVMNCFTPSTSTSGGATDGFAWTGAQLERAPGPSLFENRNKADENRDALQYFYKIAEGAVGSVRAPCTSSTTSLEVCLLQFPVPMYITPTMGYTAGFASCTTTACSALQACTAVRTSTVITGLAVDPVRAPLDCTSSAGFPAAGSATFLADDAGSGVITAWTGL